MLLGDEVLKRPVLARIILAERGADHRDDVAPGFDRAGERRRVDAGGEAGDDREPALDQLARHPRRAPDTVRARLARADHRHAAPFRRLPGALIIEQFDRMARVAQLGGIFAGMVNAHPELMDTGLLEPLQRLFGAALGLACGNEVRWERLGIACEPFRQALEAGAGLQPERLIGAELATRRDRRKRRSAMIERELHGRLLVPDGESPPRARPARPSGAGQGFVAMIGRRSRSNAPSLPQFGNSMSRFWLTCCCNARPGPG